MMSIDGFDKDSQAPYVHSGPAGQSIYPFNKSQPRANRMPGDYDRFHFSKSKRDFVEIDRDLINFLGVHKVAGKEVVAFANGSLRFVTHSRLISRSGHQDSIAKTRFEETIALGNETRRDSLDKIRARGARFEGHLLRRMDGNRRADFHRRFFLRHLHPHDSARMQRHRKNKCCDDCPFARRFVYRCGRYNSSRVRPVPCWRSRYPHHPGVPRDFQTLQCCTLHISF
jgi:hypothetical protein